MALATVLIDTADWLVAVPITQALGETVDFSGTRLSVAFTPTFGGEPIATANSDDGTLVFVPHASAPYFAIDLRVADRSWRIGRPTSVLGDILRQPEPLNPARTEWLGRVTLTIHPGTGSTGVALTSQAPVLIPTQPYDGRVVATPLPGGIQGPPGSGLPDFAFDPITDEGKVYAFKIVNGQLTIVLLPSGGGVVTPPDPGAATGALDFSVAANSGLLAALMPLGVL